VAKRLAPRSRVWGGGEGERYGHGLARAAKALPADGLALIELEAALELRRAGEKRPILLLQGFYSADELGAIAANRLTTVVHDAEAARDAGEGELALKIPVYLKLNTGMNGSASRRTSIATRSRALPAARVKSRW